ISSRRRHTRFSRDWSSDVCSSDLDLIASNSESSHQIAMKQMRGGFSNQLKLLREDLIHFASLIELELDFAEEDVEFANRDHLKRSEERRVGKRCELLES